MPPQRLHDLPDFERPPVVEVVLGVQFNNIQGFLSPHIGLVWERLRADYPKVEEHPPLLPVFEIFGPNPSASGGLLIPNLGSFPRIFFVKEGGDSLIQLQSDRFIHNWRKIREEDRYPRFERVFDEFSRTFGCFHKALEDVGLGPVVANQCEVSYINQISLSDEGTIMDHASGGQLKGLLGGVPLRELGSPEDTRLLIRYVLRDDKGTSIGRLSVSTEPMRRADGQNAVQLTLTARGYPSPRDFDGVSRFLQNGRRHIVVGFAELTDSEMHRTWGRTQ